MKPTRLVNWEMPLLGKELTELAAKKRTWVFRVLAVLGVNIYDHYQSNIKNPKPNQRDMRSKSETNPNW